jgi:hypothetical protein
MDSNIKSACYSIRKKIEKMIKRCIEVNVEINIDELCDLSNRSCNISHPHSSIGNINKDHISIVETTRFLEDWRECVMKELMAPPDTLDRVRHKEITYTYDIALQEAYSIIRSSTPEIYFEKRIKLALQSQNHRSLSSCIMDSVTDHKKYDQIGLYFTASTYSHLMLTHNGQILSEKHIDDYCMSNEKSSVQYIKKIIAADITKELININKFFEIPLTYGEHLEISN